MSSKITLNKIAELAGVSRNTVSKIVNGHYKGDSETQEKVIRLLQEYDYKGMGSLALAPDKTRNILLLAGGMIHKSFFASLLNEIQRNDIYKDYSLIYLGIQDEELKGGHIPTVIKDRRIEGIVCMEVFDKNFIEALLAYKIPTVFLDFASDIWNMRGKYDVVLMNNEYQTYSLTKKLILSGCKNISFVGDYNHCRCFFERYQGYCKALTEYKIPIDLQMCIDIGDNNGYLDLEKLWSHIIGIEVMPDAFVTAKDTIAIKIMQVLQEHHINIPEDVSIAGFDNASEAVMVTPTLTTVDCNQDALSKTVLTCLNQRINQPDKPRNIVYVDSDIINRNSTR